jgi:hypothetical protein
MKHYSFTEELSKTGGQLNFLAEIGEVTIEGYDGRSLTIEADLRDMTINVTRQEDTVSVRIEREERDVLEKIGRLFSGQHPKAIVTIRVPHTCAVRAKTITGKMQLSGVNAPVAATVVTGQNELADISGPLDARTTTGELRYTGLLSGDHHRFEAITGSIRLALDGEPNGRLDARATTGNVRCDFPLSNARMTSVIPGKHLRGVLGDGEGAINARVVTGSLHIQKASSK